MRYLWAGLGIVCVALGVIGAFLPLLPTVPFLLLAAFLFARSSERLHHWILSHRTFGPMIDDWNRSGAIRPRAKRIATLSIIALPALSMLASAPIFIVVIQILILATVLIFIWTRPNG
ncbi:YbaN family protein [Jhaorihella thermophila]|uniref:Inner membrane protein n=1 Tax=Jhaorihella thermophila TaxID=488547 RepID=A0A1H5VPE9_9RHOB|nr:YbaN family protein [Jhaorihella thermophila]SEF89195.1 hypothetical protein SAMN05421751_106161 [Jhaorihella thermophila]